VAVDRALGSCENAFVRDSGIFKQAGLSVSLKQLSRLLIVSSVLALSIGVASMDVAAATEDGITSPNTTDAVVGSAFSFTVTTSGSPTPSITEHGTLPEGVIFADNDDGTALISGSPGLARDFHFTIKATFGAGKTKYVAKQAFSLVVSDWVTASSSCAGCSAQIAWGPSGARNLTGYEVQYWWLGPDPPSVRDFDVPGTQTTFASGVGCGENEWFVYPVISGRVKSPADFLGIADITEPPCQSQP
jgi:hypothetical protein